MFDYHGLNCHQVAMVEAFLDPNPDVAIIVGTAVGPDGARWAHTWSATHAFRSGDGQVHYGGIVDHFGWTDHEADFIAEVDERCARDALAYLLDNQYPWPPNKESEHGT